MKFSKFSDDLTIGYWELADMAPCRACGCAPVLKENSAQALRLECPQCGVRTRQTTGGGCWAEWNAVMGGPTREELEAEYLEAERPWVYRAPDQDGPWLSDRHATRDEAREAARRELGGDFLTGRAVPWRPTVHADEVAEQMMFAALDECGQSGEGWLFGLRLDSPEASDLQERLQLAVDEWLRANPALRPDFFLVTDIEPAEVG